MEKKHPLSELMKTTLESVRTLADANTIIGTPIEVDGITMIPVSRMSFGVGGGGTEFSTKQSGADANFGGGSAANAKLEPVAFLVVRDGNVKLMPVSLPPITTVDRVIETVPEVVDKVTGFIENQQAKKEKKEAERDFVE